MIGLEIMIVKIAAVAYFSYKQSQSHGLRSRKFFDLFSVSHASESNEEPAKEQEAPSSKAKQLETPQTKPTDVIVDEHIVQAVIDRVKAELPSLIEHQDPQVIINILGGNHIVAPNAHEAHQNFHPSSHSSNE